MFADGHSESEPGRFARLLRDPVKLRRRGRVAAVVLTVAIGLSSDGLGIIPGIVVPLLWLALPLVALAIGYGDAFFIEHGVGMRRAVLTLITGVLTSLTACVALSTASGLEDGILERVIAASLYGMLYAGILILLSTFVGFGIGRGMGYAGSRIQNFDDENW